MTDRELLEFAAKAAGYRVVKWVKDGNQTDVAVITPADSDGFITRKFQPLHENLMTDAYGDALRLAVRLRIIPSVDEMRASAMISLDDVYWCDLSEVNNDPYAATRRAIVRAAAEIGKAMS